MKNLGQPAQGYGWQPATSGNSISWDGEAVVKRYTTPGRLSTEEFVINRLGGLPVPRLLTDPEPGTLRMAFIDGLPGSEAVEAGMAGNLLNGLGEFLRRLHQSDPARFYGGLPGVGEVLVHGDFAHYNCLIEADSGRPTAILDWEAAYLGDRITDLAWCEFQFRNRYPQQAWAITRLFQGYGSEPDVADRELAVQRRLEFLNAIEAVADEPLYAITFANSSEGSSFVAALSRFLSSPEGRSNRQSLGAQVWVDRPVTVLMNASALGVSNSRFGRLPADTALQLPSTARLVVTGEHAGAMGKEEADIFFTNQGQLGGPITPPGV